MDRKRNSTFPSIAFILAVLCLAILPVDGIQRRSSVNVSISSYGTLDHSETATPTPTPTPTPPPTPSPTHYVGTNLASLNTWKWSSSWAPCYWDTSATHSGNPSWRNVGTDPYKTREMNSKWIAVKPGDRIVFTAWMKANPSDIGTTSEIYPQSGARIGLDFYDSDGLMYASPERSAGVAYDPNGALPVWPPPVDKVVANFVPWGSDWQFRKIDCIVPQTIGGRTPEGVILWFAAMTNRMYGDYRWQNEDAPAWLSETEFYINPT